ncbi:MAG TPA: hypothetical protein VNL18_15485 [Gemmatimonadales bacterium]|nr:hypothetical protein [Gemmatimonadales bacterium]
MDWEAEYAARYGGPPRPDQPWHQVLALMARIGRFAARDILRVVEGTFLARPPEDEFSAGQRQLRLDQLERYAAGER